MEKTRLTTEEVEILKKNMPIGTRWKDKEEGLVERISEEEFLSGRYRTGGKPEDAFSHRIYYRNLEGSYAGCVNGIAWSALLLWTDVAPFLNKHITNEEYNARCPVCGYPGLDLAFIFECSNSGCQNGSRK